MILYFADRHLNILGQATTRLPEGVRIIKDNKTEDVDNGVAVFECELHFDRKTRAKVEEWAEVGNYILRSTENENEFYNITNCEIDTKNQEVYIYAEDDGLDLINDVAEPYTADQPYPISNYIERFAAGAGWTIGVNEVEGLTKQLSWTDEQTASARLLSIAKGFDNCEISFSFKIKGLQIVKKYINIYEERGKDTGVQLRLNREIDRIVISKTVDNLATALKATGGTPDGSEEPITLLGYEYDDGDFYVDGEVLKSRKALEKWSRYHWKNDDTGQAGGHITKTFSYETTSQNVLCEETIAQLKKICDMEVNYDVDISKLPDNVKIGDRVNIIDDTGALYLSSRLLILETSEVEGTRKATLGEHLIKRSGISSQVAKLAENFTKQAVSVQRATQSANAAKNLANSAAAQAGAAAAGAGKALDAANNAMVSSGNAAQSAANAQAAAQAAQAAADKAQGSVASIEQTVTVAQNAANNAQQAATTAAQKAEEAEAAAQNAAGNAENAEKAAGNAENFASSAESKAGAATKAADTAKSKAEQATATAIAAKSDAIQAGIDVTNLQNTLETVSQEMKIDYARKTDLTETTAELDTKITQNAARIESSAYKVMVVDETANNAASLLEAAETAATLAREQANSAATEAAKAQDEADIANATAEEAQKEANTAKAAYETAKSELDNALAELLAAKEDLETVSARADATEEEIATAMAAVTTAQGITSAAKESVDVAVANAKTALNDAIEAAANAEKAQAAANNAAAKANLAALTAEEVEGNASKVRTAVDKAQETANEARQTANTAKEYADTAQATADEAYSIALAAQATLEDAQAELQQAESDLEAANNRLAEVLANAEATAEEVAAAQADVETAQTAVANARTSAENAQAAANTAKTDADNAQLLADEAKASAKVAQNAADEAQKAVYEAMGHVYALEKRTSETETKIIQNSDEIVLRATKAEVTESFGNVEETASNIKTRLEAAEATIKVLSDNISFLVRKGDKTSSMVFDEESATYSFNTGEIDDKLDTHGNDIDGLKSNTAEINALIEKIQSKQDEQEEHVTISTYNDEPCIILHEEDSPYRQIITNTKRILVEVIDGVETIRGITDTENTRSKNVIAAEKSQIGGFAWKKRGENRVSLVWEGVEE